MSGAKRVHLAIVGMGTAGQARLRAAQTVIGIDVVATVSRRSAAGKIRFEEALARDDVDAVAISTENADHEGKVRAALDAGKHVLCDYPLALSAPQASDLLRLARRRRRVLHVEQIALLTPTHREVRARLAEAGPLRSGRFEFQGNWSTQLADPAYAGPFPIHVEARLDQLWDLFGSARLENVEMHADASGARFEANVVFDQGGTIEFREVRAPGLPRVRRLEARCEESTVEWPEEGVATGLFALDLSFFRQRVLHGKPGYMSDAMMLQVLEQLDAVTHRA